MRMLVFAFVLLLVGAFTSATLAKPKQGQRCDAKGRCARGLTCVTFYGVAGARGPKMTSCEIRCSSGASCPEGQHCVIIADGPGQVCRPNVGKTDGVPEHGS